MKYTEQGNMILKNASFSIKVSNNIFTINIKDGEHVGIIGRTGSGKSSIVNVIFRMIDILKKDNSYVRIGGIDT